VGNVQGRAEKKIGRMRSKKGRGPIPRLKNGKKIQCHVSRKEERQAFQLLPHPEEDVASRGEETDC